jgi:hypothetical protein
VASKREQADPPEAQQNKNVRKLRPARISPIEIVCLKRDQVKRTKLVTLGGCDNDILSIGIRRIQFFDVPTSSLNQ